jgi:hypothetical protein
MRPGQASAKVDWINDPIFCWANARVRWCAGLRIFGIMRNLQIASIGLATRRPIHSVDRTMLLSIEHQLAAEIAAKPAQVAAAMALLDEGATQAAQRPQRDNRGQAKPAYGKPNRAPASAPVDGAMAAAFSKLKG